MIVFRNSDDARLRHYCALNFRGLTSFACLSFCFKVFLFKGQSPLISRPVLHYEVFKVPLRFSATACLVYATQRSLSRTFSEFFKFFFALFQCCMQRTLPDGLKNQGRFSCPVLKHSLIILLFSEMSSGFFNIFLFSCRYNGNG